MTELKSDSLKIESLEAIKFDHLLKKDNMKNKILSIGIIIFAVLIVFGFITKIDDQSKPWPVPDKYKNMDNPVKFDKKLASSLWVKHCKSCHGADGLGDGTKAAQLDTPPGDFSTDAFHTQSDGAIFYKTLKGRDDMPSFEKKIPDQEDLWQLVHLMRTFE